MNAQRYDRFDFSEKIFFNVGKKIVDLLIYRGTIAQRLGDSRARDQAAQIALVHVTGGVVVGVKKVRVFGNLRLISGHPFFQNKGLKKPGGVGEMPFRRTDIRHRLHHAILRRKVLTESRGEVADLMKAGEQQLRGR